MEGGTIRLGKRERGRREERGEKKRRREGERERDVFEFEVLYMFPFFGL
jgi:hypothetical protein